MIESFRPIRTDQAPAAIGPYSQGTVTATGLCFTAGQVGLDPVTGQMVPGGIEAETRRVLDNLRGVLGSAGYGLHQVVKTTVFLVDMAEFAAMNAIYQEWFRDPFPARSTVQVSALPRGARVEIEAVAAP